MFFVGVDAGGTKTESVLYSDKGEILSSKIGLPANLRNDGLEKAVSSVVEVVNCYPQEIESLYVGFPGVAEEFSARIEEIESLIKEKTERVLKVKVGSDQEVAFRSGTNLKEGVVAIAGTGSVVRGWRGRKDVKVGGWGWLADYSGAYQVGQEALKKTAEAFDGRREKTLLTEEVMKFFNANHINQINEVLYQNNHIKILSPLAITTDNCAKEGDEIAVDILKEASINLSFSFKAVIKQLDFEEEFPLVIVGSMFKSKIFKEAFEERVREYSSLSKIIYPSDRPAVGAVRLSMEI